MILNIPKVQSIWRKLSLLIFEVFSPNLLIFHLLCNRTNILNKIIPYLKPYGNLPKSLLNFISFIHYTSSPVYLLVSDLESLCNTVYKSTDLEQFYYHHTFRQWMFRWTASSLLCIILVCNYQQYLKHFSNTELFLPQISTKESIRFFLFSAITCSAIVVWHFVSFLFCTPEYHKIQLLLISFSDQIIFCCRWERSNHYR